MAINKNFGYKTNLAYNSNLAYKEPRQLEKTNHIKKIKLSDFYKNQTIGCICSKKFPICVCNNIPKAKLITKKPILPSCDEISFNKRAHFCKT